MLKRLLRLVMAAAFPPNGPQLPPGTPLPPSPIPRAATLTEGALLFEQTDARSDRQVA